ncbi:hypothetical protein ACHAWT_008506 [Skeletonema menzelii]
MNMQHHRGGGGSNRGGAGQQNNRYDRSYHGRPPSGANGGNNYYDQHEYDQGHFHRRDDDQQYHQQQQQQQQHEPRYNDNRRPTRQQQQYFNEAPPQNNSNYSHQATIDNRRDNGKWQRGQTPAQRHYNHAHLRAGDGRGANNSNPNTSHQNNRSANVAPITSRRNNSSSSGNRWNNDVSNPSHHNAWGKKDSSSAASKSDGTVKVENQSSTTNNNETTKKSMKQSVFNNNAWKKPNLSSSSSATEDVSVRKEFPPLSSSKESSSQHETIPSSGDVNGSSKVDEKMVVEEDDANKHIITTSSSSTLPTNSSWGKSHSSSSSLGWAAAKLPPPSEIKKKKQGTTGEEFPSLSASLDAVPPPPPRKQPPQGGQTTTDASSLKNGETSKKGGSTTSKKSAPSTNLASFLLPQLEESDKKKQSKTTTTNKKQQPSTNAKKAGQTTANVHVDNKKKHPRDDALAPFQQHHHHSAITSTTNVGAPPIKKGRQRLAPRKKKLTTLKKRVLEERLRVWKERNGEEANVDLIGSAAGGGGSSSSAGDEIAVNMHQEQNHQVVGSSFDENEKSTTLLVDNFVNPEEDDLTDDDEHDELVTNLINLAGRVGRVVSVYIPRPLSTDHNDGKGGGESAPVVDDESNHVGLSFVRMATYQDAHAARDILDGMVVGGQKLRTRILCSMELEVCDCEFVKNSSAASPSEENERQWHLALLQTVVADRTSSSLQDNIPLCGDGGGSTCLLSSSLESTIVFYNILSSDDYEDEDALEESIEDIKSIAGQYGHVANARGDDAGNVYVTYDSRDVASFAAQKLDGMLLGGVPITVSVDSIKVTNPTQQAGSSTVVLDHVLSEDDFEDEDCLNESIEDIRSLAEKYGVVGNLIVDTSNEEKKGKIHVEYTGGIAVAREAAKQLNGMMFGGRLISAVLLSSGTIDTNMDNSNVANAIIDDKKVEQEPPQPMFSGDKVIPERFAQCKRVPKVANSGMPRAYASKIADPGAIPLLTEVLGELMRLQQRAKDQKNARSRRRLVMGLREVARGIRAHKVKMVVMANNLDEYGAIDSKLQEILDLAHAEDVPVIYELNKRKLGKAVGKSIKVAVVGIQNVMGAEQQFKQLKRMAGIA